MKKRSDGRYQVSVLIGHKEDGSPKRKVVYGSTQKEANTKANELRAMHNMGMMIDNDITVEEWADMWLKTYKQGIEYNTLKMYSDVLRVHIIPHIGDFRVCDVKTANLQQIINQKHTDGLTRTLKIIRITCDQMFKQAMIEGIISKDPCLGVSLPKITKKHLKRALTATESDAIKKLDLDSRTKCYIYLLMYSGMRRGEILALTKDDINLETNKIEVNKSLIFKGNKSEIKPVPKTKSSIRTIPIFEQLKEVLTNHLTNTDHYLFTTAKGETITTTSLSRMWDKFISAMKKELNDECDITPHTFRHNFATILYNAGVDMKSAQTLLGHSSINVTMDIYTHLDKQKTDETINKINSYLS